MEVLGGYKLKPGDAAPPFELPGVDGVTHTLEAVKGAPVLVVAWWCNHCPYVRAWERRFVEWAKEAQRRGVAVLAVSSNDPKRYPQDDFENMKARAKEQGYTFPYLFDASQEVARAYGAQVTPHFFVFDERRRLAYQGRFDDSKDDPAAVKSRWLAEAVDALLGGGKPETIQTNAVGCSVKWKEV